MLLEKSAADQPKMYPNSAGGMLGVASFPLQTLSAVINSLPILKRK